MIVKFPPGFLEKLSHGTRKELMKRAAEHEYEEQLRWNESYYLSPNQMRIYMNQVCDASVVKTKGFQIIGDDVVSPLVRAFQRMEKKANATESILNAVNAVNKLKEET
jgi:hypothetical protein